MKRVPRTVLSVLLGLAAAGCVAVRTGDGHEARYGERQEQVKSDRVDEIVSQLVREGDESILEFFAKGRFEIDASVKVSADDRWMSIGFFPGLKKPNSQVTVWIALLVNCTFFGYPTVGSLLIEPFSEAAEAGEYHIADPGLLGCCKYTGERYDVPERTIPEPTAVLEKFRLGDFDVEVNGRVRHVPADGRLVLPGVRRRERVTVRILSRPRLPEDFADTEVGRTAAGLIFVPEWK